MSTRAETRQLSRPTGRSRHGASGRQRSVRSGNDKLKQYIKPMLARLSDEAFDDPDWIFEIKWDGYRAIAEIRPPGIRLYSRNGLSFMGLYPKVAAELEKIGEEAILDGEIVVLNEKNKPDFQKLQQYDHNPSLPILYYVFDCLSWKGTSITHLPLMERKEIAKQVLRKSNIVRYSDHVVEFGRDFFTKVIDMDLEGMVAKLASSPYLPGKRTGDWLKIKNHNTHEAIIAGYTAPRGSREFFGALILGIYQRQRLRYIGHTGTGFTSAILREVHDQLKLLKRDTSPFDSKVPVNSPVTWVEPKIVCEVKFTEMTEEGILRHPVFMGLRIDKAAEETDTLDVKAKVTPKAHSAKTGKSAKRGKSPVKNSSIVHLGGRELTVSNRDKIYFPDENITKGEIIDYYQRIHKYILPYLQGRPESLKRNPHGINDRGFFQKDAGDGAPSWVETVSVPSESTGKDVHYIVCNDRPTLLYLNNLGCIELNPWSSRVASLHAPDYMVIDLDPSEKNSFDEVIDAALVVKEVLDQAGAPSYCKTSGASGLHIYVPVKAQYEYEQVRSFAGIVARLTEDRLPATTTVERSLNKRKGRIYLDYQQNKIGQTLASVYSVRPKPGATVSTPLLWKEVRHGLHPSQFTIRNIEKRLAKTGDLFRGVLKDKINLSKCLKNLGV
jgi:bifunctional non-homologous end joining protein LigD